MNILKLFDRYESSIYSNPEDQLKAMRRWSVEWQKYRCSERFHIIKKRGNFTGTEFFKFVRDTKELIGGEIGYEGIEKFPISGACTIERCRAHARMAKIEKSIGVNDTTEYYSCEVRLDLPKAVTTGSDTEWSNYVWLTSESYGKKIKWQITLNRDLGDKIIDKYFVKNNKYYLGDGFI